MMRGLNLALFGLLAGFAWWWCLTYSQPIDKLVRVELFISPKGGPGTSAQNPTFFSKYPEGASWVLDLQRGYIKSVGTIIQARRGGRDIDMLWLSFHWPTMRSQADVEQELSEVERSRNSSPTIGGFYFQVFLKGKFRSAESIAWQRRDALVHGKPCAHDPRRLSKFVLVSMRGGCDAAPQGELYYVKRNGEGPFDLFAAGASAPYATASFDGWEISFGMPAKDLDNADDVFRSFSDFMKASTKYKDILEVAP